MRESVRVHMCSCIQAGGERQRIPRSLLAVSAEPNVRLNLPWDHDLSQNQECGAQPTEPTRHPYFLIYTLLLYTVLIEILISPLPNSVTWKNSLITLRLRFLICKIGMVRLTISEIIHVEYWSLEPTEHSVNINFIYISHRKSQ